MGRPSDENSGGGESGTVAPDRRGAVAAYHTWRSSRSLYDSGGLLTDPNKGEMIEEALEPIMVKYFKLPKESMARYRGVRRRCSTRPTTPESQGGGSQGESRESNGEGGEAAEMMLEGRAMVVREKSLRHSRSGRLPKDQSMAAAYSRLGFCGVEREGQSVSISVPTRSRRRKRFLCVP